MFQVTGESYDNVIINTQTILNDKIFEIGDTFDNFMKGEYWIVYKQNKSAVNLAVLQKADLSVQGKISFTRMDKDINNLFEKLHNEQYMVDYVGTAHDKLIQDIKKALPK